MRNMSQPKLAQSACFSIDQGNGIGYIFSLPRTLLFSGTDFTAAKQALVNGPCFIPTERLADPREHHYFQYRNTVFA